jgi:hypothetical protein
MATPSGFPRRALSDLAMAYFPHLLAQAVSSVLARFTAVFGMGTGGTTPLGSPDRGSGGGIRTLDLRVMSPTSCHCSTPRRRPKSKSEETG